jgi:hypothetical protein
LGGRGGKILAGAVATTAVVGGGLALAEGLKVVMNQNQNQKCKDILVVDL